jgi:hypothetical protein
MGGKTVVKILCNLHIRFLWRFDLLHC